MEHKPSLFMVATPVGNLQDITVRALEILRSVDAIVCEHPLVTSRLLTSYHIHKPLMRIHQHSTSREHAAIVEHLRKGESLAYVSDAGTPGLNDPGGSLIATVIASLGDDVRIVPVPGASAVTSLISVAGIPMDQYLFLGFPPHKKGRNAFFQNVLQCSMPAIFYESTHRIMKSLEQLIQALQGQDRYCIVGRELTKQFETIYRGTIPEVIEQLKHGSTKGEFVIIVSRWIPKKVN